jgi:hypothetical protein
MSDKGVADAHASPDRQTGAFIFDPSSSMKPTARL